MDWGCNYNYITTAYIGTTLTTFPAIGSIKSLQVGGLIAILHFDLTRNYQVNWHQLAGRKSASRSPTHKHTDTQTHTLSGPYVQRQLPPLALYIHPYCHVLLPDPFYAGGPVDPSVSGRLSSFPMADHQLLVDIRNPCRQLSEQLWPPQCQISCRDHLASVILSLEDFLSQVDGEHGQSAGQLLSTSQKLGRWDNALVIVAAVAVSAWAESAAWGRSLDVDHPLSLSLHHAEGQLTAYTTR
ncbi:hypothetical protein LIA77_08708 [Sarocladium implicatum]|nr:hypothetical protein LIA77_08708 [Sarocladium implicatum]